MNNVHLNTLARLEGKTAYFKDGSKKDVDAIIHDLDGHIPA